MTEVKVRMNETELHTLYKAQAVLRQLARQLMMTNANPDEAAAAGEEFRATLQNVLGDTTPRVILELADDVDRLHSKAHFPMEQQKRKEN